MVKSPYNFVSAPSEGEVFKPDWVNFVSHDAPFEDGESGEITVKITAETPIFVRNGHTKGVEENEFSNINGQYFIPATSIKGMLRNVLEIMSFSRMKLVSDDRYAFRDLTRNSLYMKTYRSQEVKAGWLSQNNAGQWQIEECELLAHISHIELANPPFNFSFRRDYLAQTPTDKSAKAKYIRINPARLVSSFRVRSDNHGKVIAEHDAIGMQGTLVFTGQSSKRNEQRQPSSGKINEFVFFDMEAPSYIQLSEKQIKDFKFIYLDHDKNNISVDWKFWRTKLEHGEKVPVFYSKDNTGNLKHFGLSFMYKLPFQHSIHEMKPINEYNTKQVDLAELIFGYSNDGNSLKGRVFISNAFTHNAVVLPIRSEILGSPKASYFPFYLDQFKSENNGVKIYNTYQDKATLKGYKRYVTQRSIPTTPFEERYTSDQRNNQSVFSRFIPLDSGTEFSFKIRFHNLKKSEIGALLSSLTFHGENHKYFHSLGAAKPFGYGKIKVGLVEVKDVNFTIEEYLCSFEEIIGRERILSERLKKLFAMASTNENISYPSLERFVEIKKQEESIWEYDTSSVKIEMISEKIEKNKKREELSSNYDLSTILNFKALRNKIKEDFDDNVPDEIRESICSCIKAIFDEKETKKTFREKTFNDNPWQLPIAIWLGQEKAKELFGELS